MSRFHKSVSSKAAYLAILLAVSSISLPVAADHKLTQEDYELIPANLPSANASISVNGRFVAFHSEANNLVPNDTNNEQDIFVYDRQEKTMERVSVTTHGKQSNNYSIRPVISGDGRFVAYMSLADNLVENDNNHQFDIFVRDRKENTTSLVSISTKGTSGRSKSMNPVISTDGCYVAFESFADDLIPNDENENPDIFVRNIIAGKTETVSLSTRGQQANHGSSNPAISSDGRFVLFQSPARNLVPSDNNRSDSEEWNFSDVFLRNRKTGKTEIISVNSDGKPANHPSSNPTVSADGRYVAFVSSATDLVPDYPTTSLEISGKGRTARRIDVYVRDRIEGKTKLISVAPDGSYSNHQSQAPKISANGRYVTFQSSASNLTEKRLPGTLINIYLRDIQEDKTKLVTSYQGPLETNVMAAHSSVSGDGNLVVFDTNYGHKGEELARASDVYVWNSETGKMELISFTKKPKQDLTQR